MPRLTQRTVARAKARKSRYELSCSVLTGFTLRVLPSGKKAYYVRYRDELGKDRRCRIGATTEVSFEEAVQRATEKLSGYVAPAAVRAPAAKRTPAAKPPPAARHEAGAPLFEHFADRFLQEHVTVHLKPKTQQNYCQVLRARLVPKFGRRRIDEIEFADVARFHASMLDTPYAANACLLILSSIYSRAIEWGVLGRDFMPPTRGVKKFKARSRERFLTPKERARLDRYLDEASEAKGRHRLAWSAVAAIRLLAMTGMRRDEVLNLTWEMVDYRHRCFRLPDSKTGAKVVPVSKRALELVRECRLRWESCGYDPKPDYVIYSRNGKRLCSSSLSKTWSLRVRDRIPGLKGVRLHDLRHSMASDAIMAGVPLAVVGKILGHRRPETTARYAHIADSVLTDAVEKVSEAMEHNGRTGKRGR